LFLTQFFGAFNDNLFKNALVILITFKLAEAYKVNGQILITLVAGVFILPFFLLSAFAGQIADKYEKSTLVHIIKFAEILLMIMTAIAFNTMSLWWLIILLFFMGVHSTFFGPLKFSILPQHLHEDELVAGNGLVSAGTFIAILTGTLCGGLLILHRLGRIYISAGIIGVAIAGFTASLFIPKASAPTPDMRIDWNVPHATWSMLAYIIPNKPVFRSLLGISWFWFLGAVFLAQCPTFAKDIIGGNEEVSTLFIVIFAVGVGVGSTFCNKLLSGRISGKSVPFACLGMSISTFMLYAFSTAADVHNALWSIADFLKLCASWGIVVSLFLLAVFGGLFSVPMYAIMQAKSNSEHMARSVACLNIMDSFGMVFSAVFTAVMLVFHVSIINIFLIIGIVNLFFTPLLSRLAKEDNK